MLIEFYIIMISHLIAKCIYNQFICLSWFWHRHITASLAPFYRATVSAVVAFSVLLSYLCHVFLSHDLRLTITMMMMTINQVLLTFVITKAV